MKKKIISVVGTVGVPATYGGFETLVENLAVYHHNRGLSQRLVIYCSKTSYQRFPKTFLSAELHYISLNANGVQSIFYDIASLFFAVLRRSDEILVLGLSGAIALPLVRLISSAKITTNIDGLEWRREKWRGFAKWFLHFSESVAVKFSHSVIADNEVILDYVNKSYGVKAHLIAYGGDHAELVDSVDLDGFDLPTDYSLSICRIEPENNIHIILEAFSFLELRNLIFIGNWDGSEYGRGLKNIYSKYKNITLLDPIYETTKIKKLRQNATFYLHGHSAGGTNPSLVEAMHFGIPILAFDCGFNRSTTENMCLYFSDVKTLVEKITDFQYIDLNLIGIKMKEIALRRYTWGKVAKEYFDILSAV